MKKLVVRAKAAGLESTPTHATSFFRESIRSRCGAWAGDPGEPGATYTFLKEAS